MIATFEQIQEMEINKDTVTRFTIDSETVKGIKQIFKGHKNSSLPILNNLLVEVVNKNVIKVTYTNCDLTVEKMFLTTVNDINTTRFLIPIQIFKNLKYVKKNEVFSFIEKDKETMLLMRNTIETEFSLNDIKEYPTFNFEKQEFETVQTSTGYEYFDNQDLQSLVKATKSVSDSETRPILQEVAISNKTIVSTDSHRLFKANTVFTHDKTILINPALIHKVNELIPSNAFMKMSVSEHNVKITDDMTTNVYHRQKVGNFPDTSRLLPTDFNYEMKVNNVVSLYNFLKGLKNSNVRNQVVKVVINAKTHKMDLEADSDFGNSKISLPIEMIKHDKEEFKISFSSKYFMQAMEQLDNEAIVVKFVSNMRPFILEKQYTSKEQALVLPVRTY
jgi:DNA polymerase III subunit beta